MPMRSQLVLVSTSTRFESNVRSSRFASHRLGAVALSADNPSHFLVAKVFARLQEVDVLRMFPPALLRLISHYWGQ